MLAVRANLNGTSGYERLVAEYTWPGLWFVFSTRGEWTLQDRANHAAVIASGMLPAAPLAGQWHTYSLVVRGDKLSAYMDGEAVLAEGGLDVSSYCAAGWVGYGAAKWGHQPTLDSFSVEPA